MNEFKTGKPPVLSALDFALWGYATPEEAIQHTKMLYESYMKRTTIK